MANVKNPGSKVMHPAHVVLRTNHFHRMKEFYKPFLGAHATYENDFLSFLTYDEEHHHIAILSIPDVEDKVRTSSGLEHIAFTFENLNQLAMTYLQWKEKSIDPFWAVNHGPTTSIYYKDPDGNILETQVENFDSTEQVIAFMESEAYNINIDFDVDELINRLESGEDHAIINKRPESGPRGIDSVPA